MKKLLLTTSVLAAVAGSQLGYAACADSGVGDAVTPATCDSDVTLQVSNLVVIKGLDDYDFTGAPGWDGTTGTDSVINGDLCIGTNNAANGVDVTISSANGGFSATGATGGPIAYNVYFDGNATAVTDGTPISVANGNLDNLTCASEDFALDVEFTGAQLLAAVGGVSYTDTVTVSVEPQ